MGSRARAICPEFLVQPREAMHNSDREMHISPLLAINQRFCDRHNPVSEQSSCLQPRPTVKQARKGVCSFKHIMSFAAQP